MDKTSTGFWRKLARIEADKRMKKLNDILKNTYEKWEKENPGKVMEFRR